MRFKSLKIVLVSLFFFSPISSAQAANFLDAVINEIAWMGTESSYNDEWIELYNNTNSSISLKAWLLKSADGTLEINLSGSIPANDYFLLERTDDETLPEIASDQIYKGALGNSGENLKLFDDQGNLVDEVNCSEKWFAGSNKTKQTMERIGHSLSGNIATNWQTSENSGGTPKNKNSGGVESRPEPSVPEISEPPEEPKEKIENAVYASGVIINEILPSPIGADAEEEWIEIFNGNDFEVDLSKWQVSDMVGSTITYSFPQETKVSPFGFLILTRPESKISLNNDGDEVSLLYPNNNLVESINYGKAFLGQSFARRNNNWLWTTALTPGSPNVITEEEGKEKEKAIKGDQEEMVYPSGILINEILPSPEGSDTEEEWIEIFNQTEHEVNLSEWKIEDAAGRTKAYTFPKGTIIASQGFLVLARPDSKITLNNDGDGLKIFQANGQIVDQVSYQKSPEGQSYNRTEDKWIWSETLTPGSPNIVPNQFSQGAKETLDAPEKQTANISTFSFNSRSFFVLLIALAIALFSAIIIFLIKRKIKSA